jgi:hypothetical protein
VIGSLIFCYSRNGAAIKCHDKKEDAVAQALLWKTTEHRRGEDRCVSEFGDQGPVRYTVETLEWTGDGYRELSRESV